MTDYYLSYTDLGDAPATFELLHDRAACAVVVQVATTMGFSVSGAHPYSVREDLTITIAIVTRDSLPPEHIDSIHQHALPWLGEQGIGQVCQTARQEVSTTKGQ